MRRDPSVGIEEEQPLDLTTLGPQPGFLRAATASEDPGFDPAAVESIEVRLAGPGALDNLRWAPHPGP